MATVLLNYNLLLSAWEKNGWVKGLIGGNLSFWGFLHVL